MKKLLCVVTLLTMAIPVFSQSSMDSSATNSSMPDSNVLGTRSPSTGDEVMMEEDSRAIKSGRGIIPSEADQQQREEEDMSHRGRRSPSTGVGTGTSTQPTE